MNVVFPLSLSLLNFIHLNSKKHCGVDLYTWMYVSTEQAGNVINASFPWFYQQQCISLQHTKHTHALSPETCLHVCGGGGVIQGAEEL